MNPLAPLAGAGRRHHSHIPAETDTAGNRRSGPVRRRSNPTWARLVLVATLVASSASAAERRPLAPPATNEPFAGEIRRFLAQDEKRMPPTNAVLFLGSSSIRLWTNLASDFPSHSVLNRGFGGSQISDSIRYFDHIVRPYQPRLIVFYAGGNDINAKKSPDQVVQDFETFAGMVRRELPETRLAYIAIAPNPARWAQIDHVRETNRRIANFIRSDPKMRFIDTHSEMLGADGKPKPDIFVADRLHMNPNGYRIWARVVAPYLNLDWPDAVPTAP